MFDFKMNLMLFEVPKDVPRLLINLTDAGQMCYGIIAAAGESGPLNYGKEDNVRYYNFKLKRFYHKNLRDVFWRGTCDDGSLKLAQLLGWEDELKHLAKKNK